MSVRIVVGCLRKYSDAWLLQLRENTDIDFAAACVYFYNREM